jgi:isorenieratene synthase
VVNRYEREAAAWAEATGGCVVELHSYAVTADHHDLRDRLLTEMYELYPETRHARIVGEKTLCRNDCPRFAPGDFATRPGVDTPLDGLVLAGDGIRIDLPVALMERAATTGWSAANRLLEDFGIAGHALETVPTRGRSAALRRLAGGRSR